MIAIRNKTTSCDYPLAYEQHTIRNNKVLYGRVRYYCSIIIIFSQNNDSIITRQRAGDVLGIIQNAVTVLARVTGHLAVPAVDASAQ